MERTGKQGNIDSYLVSPGSTVWEAAESKVVSLGFSNMGIPGNLSRSSAGGGTRAKAKLNWTAEPMVSEKCGQGQANSTFIKFG